MTEKLELFRGSGNVFQDLGHPSADVEQLKGILAAEIIGVLDDRKLSVRKAESVTGINASEFSRIRNVQLGRFTVDRLMTILNHVKVWEATVQGDETKPRTGSPLDECLEDGRLEKATDTVLKRVPAWPPREELRRDFGRKRFGDEGYAVEELFAELGLSLHRSRPLIYSA